VPYVVTQSCCADASCVLACPVNCIHPAPGEPGFADAEMLHVDPDGCVDCGACATACPADAIVPRESLTPAQAPFAALNAAYYETFPHAGRSPVAVVPPQRRLRRPGPFRVAVVGAGPAGLFTADELLRHPEISVDVYDRRLAPGGLVRYGVSPDHRSTKQVTRLFEAIEQQPHFRYLLGVDVGTDVSHDELASQYDAVVLAVGASGDRRLDLPGEDLPGSLAATDLVGWYNGDPDRQGLEVPLDHERAVVVGNGNVALDVARVLARPSAALVDTDIAALPWAALRRSRIREVVVLGRRGPADASFTLPELIGLAGLDDVDVVVDDRGEVAAMPDSERARVLRAIAARERRPSLRRIVLRFRAAPVRIVGGDRVTGVETAGGDVIDAGLVVRAIGFRVEAVAHERGRVRPGRYVAGWAKRGPRGFIGTNRACARETVESLLDDLDAGLCPVVDGGRPVVPLVDLAGWRALDAEERRRGAQRGRPRHKIVDREEQLRVAAQLSGAGTGRDYAAVRAH
jgi:ferredoxin--NADP+ reductase